MRAFSLLVTTLVLAVACNAMTMDMSKMKRTAKAVFTEGSLGGSPLSGFGALPTGTIMFGQDDINSATYVKVDLKGLKSAIDKYHVHVYPILPGATKSCGTTGGHFNPLNATSCDAANPQSCEYGDLSGKHGVLTGQFDVSTSYEDKYLPLFGVHSIIGRSVVLHKKSDGSRVACADIEYVGTTYKSVAIFEGDKAAPGVSPIKGEITFTQIENAETMVLVRLRKTNITVPTTLSHKWHVHVNRPNNTDYTCQLGSAGDHYDPLKMLSQANYATECAKNQMKCEMGDLVGKGGALDFNQASPSTPHFYTDINLPVMSSSPGIAGRSVVIHAHDSSNKIACASIIYMGKFSPRKAVAKFDVANVAKGTIAFSQMSMTSPTHVMVDLMEMKGGAAGYHVHMYPMASAAAGCGPESTGGHFNPNNGATPCDPLYSYNCEYGDLSGKHGSLSAGTASSQSYFDFDLPMFGKDSIIGRSVVIHNSAGSRVACANIDFIGKTMKSVATFESNQPVSGTITFTNFEGSSETSVFVDLQKDDKSNSSGHKWHVHEKSVPSSGACADTGGHYDPYAVKTSRPNYGTVCSNGAGASGQQLGCEVGDLVLKSKPLDFSATGVSRFFYTDLQLPVTNPTANEAGIGGRSITLHVSGGGGDRYTCGSVAYSGSTDNTPASAGPTSDGSSSTSFGDETWHIAVVSAGGAVIVMLGLFMLMKKTGSA